MQRRNPHLQQHQATSAGTSGSSSSSLLPKQPLQPRTTTLSSSATSLSKPHNGLQNGIMNRSSSRTGISIWVLVLIIILLAIVISIFPEQRQMMYNTEQRIEHAMYETEQQIEHDVMEWLSSKQQQQQQYGDEYKGSDADIRMQQQSSSWVDGEKKLKNALKVLVDRQEKGMDLGVPVLTRWLGDDLPVFYSKDDTSLNMGLTLEEWNQQIEKRYEQMRQDEDHWRKMVIRTLDKQRG